MKNGIKRTQFVDMMKGSAILWVVFYHLLGPGPVKTVFTQLIDVALVVFFLFSGYFHRPGKKSIGANLKSRAKSLLIPFFKYSLFFWVVGTLYLLSTGTTTLVEALCCLRNFFGGCIWNRTIQNWLSWDYHSLGRRYPFLADFWFLIAMMLASILFFLIIDRVIRSKWKTLITAAGLFAITGVLRGFTIDLPYNIQIVPFWTAVMVLGAFAGQYKLFENDILTGAKEWVLSILSLAAGVTISMLKPANPDMFRGAFPENEVVNMLLCIASSLLIIWGLGIIFKKIEKAGVRVRELAWLGSHSLLIYLYHMFFAWIISIITGFSLRYPEEADAVFFWNTVLLALACLLLCILRYVFADVITGKLSKDPAVWGKARTVILSLTLAGIALAAGLLGYRGVQQAWNDEKGIDLTLHKSELEGMIKSNPDTGMIYVTGHKDPDTDAVCSSILWADLLNAMGYEATPVINGGLNKEANYVLQEAGKQAPESVADAAEKTFFIMGHSEGALSDDGMDKARIIGVIDHLGGESITADNQVFYETAPLGSTATLVWMKYREYGVPVSADAARLIVSGILSETQNLTSERTTDADRQAVEVLASIADISDVDAYYEGMSGAASS